MSRPIITVDIETYSEQDIKKVGAYRYAQDPSFEVLLLGYAIGENPPEVIDLTKRSLPDDVREILLDNRYTKRAHNAVFEWWCLSEYFGLDTESRNDWLEQWECSMIHTLYCGLPGALGDAGKALQQPAEAAKMREGKALIQYFCKPCKPTKANGGRTRNLPHHDYKKWELFVKYNAQDVAAERANDKLLTAWPVPDFVMAEWRDDVRMNAAGVGIDMALTDGALRCAADVTDDLTREAKLITGLPNPNSTAQLLPWLAARGADLENLQKATVEKALGTDLPKDVLRVLELRLQMSKASIKKYDAIKAATGPDGRIRGTLQFYGASRTGRWAGRLLQVQNLPRTYLSKADQRDARNIVKLHDAESLEMLYDDVNDTLSQLIRTAIVPEKGKIFIDADFSAIEARLIAWEAGEEWVLDVFRTSGKIYEATAAKIFGIPFDTIVKGNPNYKYRQRGKVATLALGYQGGIGAMKRMGGDQLGLDDNGLQDIVNRWRKQNPKICALWRKMETAARDTILRKVRNKVIPGVEFRLEASKECPYPFLTMSLPSGRKLFYAKPDVRDDGHLTYWEQDTGKWQQAETYGGKLTENLTQAIGRDCLAFALKNLRVHGYNVVFHVHDEVVIEIATQNPAQELKRVVEIMSEVPPWAKGLPLNADGWYGGFFTKD